MNVIARLRRQKGLTQAQVVEALKPALSLRTLQLYEAGDRQVSADHARALAKLFDVEPDYLRFHAGLAGRVKSIIANTEFRDALTDEEREALPAVLSEQIDAWFTYMNRMRRMEVRLKEAMHRLSTLAESNLAEDQRLFDEFIAIQPGEGNVRERFAENRAARDLLKPLLQEQSELQGAVIQMVQQLQESSPKGIPIAAKIDQYVIQHFGEY